MSEMFKVTTECEAGVHRVLVDGVASTFTVECNDGVEASARWQLFDVSTGRDTLVEGGSLEFVVAAAAKLIARGRVSEAVAHETLRTAQLHSWNNRFNMSSSAKHAAADAEACFNRGDFSSAFERSLTSLVYSVGVRSAVYRMAVRRVP